MNTQNKRPLTKEERLGFLLDEKVNLPTHQTTMRQLVTQGVAKGIIYYNYIEKRQNSAAVPFKIVKSINGFGLVFTNNLTLKNIHKDVFKYATRGVEIEEVKERKSSFNLK